MTRALGLALASTLALTTIAAAAPMHGREALKRYCSGDAATLCAGVDPGQPMEACFRKHRRELSKPCRRAIDAYRAGGGR